MGGFKTTNVKIALLVHQIETDMSLLGFFVESTEDVMSAYILSKTKYLIPNQSWHKNLEVLMRPRLIV